MTIGAPYSSDTSESCEVAPAVWEPAAKRTEKGSVIIGPVNNFLLSTPTIIAANGAAHRTTTDVPASRSRFAAAAIALISSFVSTSGSMTTPSGIAKNKSAKFSIPLLTLLNVIVVLLRLDFSDT